MTTNRIGFRAASLRAATAVAAALFAAGLLAGCGRAPMPSPLAGTSWRLVEFQSMDDAIGTIRPDVPSDYRMELRADSTALLKLICNYATGTWTSEPFADGRSGSFELGRLAMTLAACPSEMGDRIVEQASYVRSYVLADGRLYLSLMADAGIQVWEPADGSTSAVTDAGTDAAGPPYAAPEDGGPRDWEATGDPDGADLALLERPMAGAAVVATVPAGTILDNLGCEPGEGDEGGESAVWCDVQPLGGGPRGYAPADRLTPAVSPDGSVATGPDESALRAGQGDFDATGQLPCAQSAGQPMGRCDFGVARAGGGYATVVVTRPDGRTRAIFFRLGRPIGADTSEADPGGEFEAMREADLHLIRLGGERYEIPDAVVLGG